jgi:hypothetical protein
MKFHEMLQANRGNLFILKSELFLKERMCWDGCADRLFVLVDARAGLERHHGDGIARGADEVTRYNRATITALINNRVYMIHVARSDVELVR